MFLRQGQYPNPALMFLGIKPVSTIGETRSVGYSFMSRYGQQIIFLTPSHNMPHGVRCEEWRIYEVSSPASRHALPRVARGVNLRMMNVLQNINMSKFFS